MATYNFSQLKEKTKEVDEWLKRELGGIRTGRATPAVLDSVMVEAYGARQNLKQVANISVEDPKTLRVSPWDESLAKSVEKAITVANLGLSVAVDDKGVRVSFPELTGERRTALLKVAKEKLEQAKVSLRKHRDETWNDIQAKEKAKEVTEDDKFRLKNEMQKLIDEAQKKLDEVMEKKEKEISS